MGWLARAVVGIGLAVGGLGLVALPSCAEPTQIVVTVFSDACQPRKINRTNVYVGRSGDIDTRPPSAVHDGCETGTGVGSLTVYPSGDKDEEVAIKVVSGIDSSPDLCAPPGHPGCIAQTRVMRFVPNTTQRLVVKLSLACLNRTCPNGTTCDTGVCKQADDVLDDGGTRDDASIVEAGVVEAGVDGAVADPCVGCAGTCSNGVCKVDCAKISCSAGAELCAPTLPCEIRCAAGGSCADARCTTTQSCSFDCGDKKGSCTKVTCTADTCDVRCQGNESCVAGSAGGIVIDAKTKGTLLCDGENACDKASCASATCELSCDPIGGPKGACPPPGSRPCVGDCSRWNNPIDAK